MRVENNGSGHCSENIQFEEYVITKSSSGDRMHVEHKGIAHCSENIYSLKSVLFLGVIGNTWYSIRRNHIC